MRQQRHRPARGLVAAAAGVAARAAASRCGVSLGLHGADARCAAGQERGGLMLGPVLDEPAVHAGAVDPAAAGRLGDGMPLGHQQQRLEAAIHPGLTGASKRGGEPLAIRLVEPRLGRVIMVLHAP